MSCERKSWLGRAERSCHDSARARGCTMSEAITSDNIHLSKVIHADCEPVSGAIQNPLAHLNCTDPKILEFVETATAPSTRRASQSDLSHFVGHGGAIPATAEQVARSFVDHAAVFTTAPPARRLVSIRVTHLGRGL